jgi:hypothetical protein
MKDRSVIETRRQGEEILKEKTKDLERIAAEIKTEGIHSSSSSFRVWSKSGPSGRRCRQ